MSKGYTIQSFIDILSSVNHRAVNANNIYNVVAPRGGYDSVKAQTLDTFLFGSTTAIAQGAGVFANLGATPKARVLKALRNRQRTGSLFGK